MSKDRKSSTLLHAFKYAIDGIVSTFKNERNIRIEFCFAVVALALSALLKLSPVEWAIIIILVVLVLALELANSAIENLVNLVSPEKNPLAKQVKDGMAASVLVMALGSAAAGLIIFINAALRLGGI